MNLPIQYRGRNIIGGLFLIVWLAFIPAPGAEGASGHNNSTDAAHTPTAVFPVTTYDFGTVMEGAKITHDFVLENQGSATLEINKVQPD